MYDWNKSDIKCWNTLSYLDQYMCRVLRLWNSRDREAVYVDKWVQRIETVKKSGMWSGLDRWQSCIFYGGCEFTLVVEPNIREIWIFKLNFTMKININKQ